MAYTRPDSRNPEAGGAHPRARREVLPRRPFSFHRAQFQYPIALEDALKLKEIAYIHSEGYAAGEMKHGPVALIDPRFPTLALALEDGSYEQIVSNMQEIRTREGKILAITTEGNTKLGSLVDDVTYIPRMLEAVAPLLTVVPLQLFAYYSGVLLGRDVDKHRNRRKG